MRVKVETTEKSLARAKTLMTSLRVKEEMTEETLERTKTLLTKSRVSAEKSTASLKRGRIAFAKLKANAKKFEGEKAELNKELNKVKRERTLYKRRCSKKKPVKPSSKRCNQLKIKLAKVIKENSS